MREKGRPVFLDYDQAALDAAYDQAAYAPNREQLIKRRISDSQLARLCIGEPERVAYGPAEIERLDIYRTARASAPVFVFIHGGAWRSGRSKDFAAPAEMFLAAGAHYIVPDFAWVQDVGGSLMVLANQVCRAIAWVYENAAHLGSDPNRVYVGGQSSGGHLAAVALTTDWQRDFGLPANIIRGGVCISGMYDLMPVQLSARNTYVTFDDATVAALSPIRHLDRLHAPLIISYGTCETPEFQRQNREFAAAVEAAGKKVRLLVGENYNHFELPETLGHRPAFRHGDRVLPEMRQAMAASPVESCGAHEWAMTTSGLRRDADLLPRRSNVKDRPQIAQIGGGDRRSVDKPGQHRRRGKHRNARMALQCIEDSVDVKMGQHDLVPAPQQMRQRVKACAVRQRTCMKVGVTLVECVDIGVVAMAHEEQVAVAQHSAFRSRGRPARVKEPCPVGWRAIDGAHRRACCE